MLTHKRITELAEECAAALGIDPVDMLGTTLLGWLDAAERAGATVYWGCLPDRSVLRRTVIAAIEDLIVAT